MKDTKDLKVGTYITDKLVIHSIIEKDIEEEYLKIWEKEKENDRHKSSILSRKC